MVKVEGDSSVFGLAMMEIMLRLSQINRNSQHMKK